MVNNMKGRQDPEYRWKQKNTGGPEQPHTGSSQVFPDLLLTHFC